LCLTEVNEKRIVFLRGILLFTVIMTSLFAFINNLTMATWAILISCLALMVSYSANKKIFHKKLLLSMLFVNTVYMIAGNVLFSPNIKDGYGIDIFIFSINAAGLERGL
jgi:hypothetical protein